MSLRCWRSVGESSTTRMFLIVMCWLLRELRRKRARAGVLLHPLEERFLGKWLGEIAVRAGEPPARAVEHSVLARKHDHGRGLQHGVLLDERAGLVAVEARHHDVD